jgi:hypothetical protein
MGDNHARALRYLARRAQLSRSRREVKLLLRRHVERLQLEFVTTPAQLVESVLRKAEQLNLTRATASQASEG